MQIRFLKVTVPDLQQRVADFDEVTFHVPSRVSPSLGVLCPSFLFLVLQLPVVSSFLLFRALVSPFHVALPVLFPSHVLYARVLVHVLVHVLVRVRVRAPALALVPRVPLVCQLQVVPVLDSMIPL